jgi:hypothetical protein
MEHTMKYKCVLQQLMQKVAQKRGNLTLSCFNDKLKTLANNILADPQDLDYLEFFYTNLLGLGESQGKLNTLLLMYQAQLVTQLTEQEIESLDFTSEVKVSNGMSVYASGGSTISNVIQSTNGFTRKIN